MLPRQPRRREKGRREKGTFPIVLRNRECPLFLFPRWGSRALTVARVAVPWVGLGITVGVVAWWAISYARTRARCQAAYDADVRTCQRTYREGTEARALCYERAASRL